MSTTADQCRAMVAITVDFDRLVRGGLVKAHQKNATEVLTVGSRVYATDFDDSDMSFTGTVVAVEGESVFLQMDWTIGGAAPTAVPVQPGAFMTLNGQRLAVNGAAQLSASFVKRAGDVTSSRTDRNLWDPSALTNA